MSEKDGGLAVWRSRATAVAIARPTPVRAVARSSDDAA